MARGVAGALLLAELVACSAGGEPPGGDDGTAAASPPVTRSATPSPTQAPSPSPSPSATPALPTGPPDAAALAGVRLRLQPVATVERPTGVFAHGSDLFVTEVAGRVRVVRSGRLEPEPLLDLRDQVGDEGEGGLLGLAFAPDGRHLYVSYTDVEQDSRVVEYAFDGRSVDPASRRVVLAVDQPEVTHNGGGIAFGPDGMLWIGLGDGGHSPGLPRNAQDPSTLLGSMLRIDVRPSGGLPYTVPPDNPFVGRAGARPEVWAKGLRNPWRWSFGPDGRLWIGDVGEAEREEVTVLDPARDAGANLGWPALEGTRRHLRDVPVPAGARPPTLEYPHDDDECSVVGGHVYRGRALPALRGAYVYADTCQAQLRAVSLTAGQVVASRVFPEASVAGRTLVSLGEDADGELYVVSIDGPVLRVVPG